MVTSTISGLEIERDEAGAEAVRLCSEVERAGLLPFRLKNERMRCQREGEEFDGRVPLLR